MNISISEQDIKNWIELAATSETMNAKLLECATIYALANPNHTIVIEENANRNMFESIVW